MSKRKLKVGDIVYSRTGTGVITKCFKGVLGDSEVVYEVEYFNLGKKISRIKDFHSYI